MQNYRSLFFLISLLVLLFCSQSHAARKQQYTGPDDPQAIQAAEKAVARLGQDRGGLALTWEVRELVGLSDGIGGAGIALHAEVLEARKTLVDLGAEESDLGYKLALSGDVLFEFDKANIRPEAEEQLQKLADALAQLGKTQVRIIGHTDSKGSDTYNQNLSQLRADAVRSWLSQTVESGHASFHAEGKGESEPVASNTHPDGSDNPEGRAKNRRVEIYITEEAH
ncbi:OmpA family protein [Desulfogranum japonicum]|uniref:OmpA family protein n=1 Tax=Desulfogranum japonicum TaxID=231447 RepID=UPI00040DC978|nr:OmpA family protein [Desulfogranum japonicum]